MIIKRLMIWATALIYWGCVVAPIFYILLPHMSEDYEILYFFVGAIVLYLIIYRLMIFFYLSCKQREVDRYADIQQRRTELKAIQKEQKQQQKEQKRASKKRKEQQQENLKEQPEEMQVQVTAQPDVIVEIDCEEHFPTQSEKQENVFPHLQAIR